MSELDALAAQLDELDAGPAAKPRPGRDPVQNRGQKNYQKMLAALVLLIVLLLGLIGGGLWYLLAYGAKSPLAREEEALGGRLAAMPQEDWGEALNQLAEEGQVLLGIAAEPVFELNGKRGRIGIENDAANRYSFQVTIVESATGEELYESGLLAPGHYIEYIELNKALAPGDYAAAAVFTTYSLEESPDPIARITVDLTLHVTDGRFYD